jgi:hypothetical protein
MKTKNIINIALGLVFIACIYYWREVWGWVGAKTWDELAADIIGFCLKWFYLAIFGWLAVQVPHYVTPWLKLARLSGRRRLKAARRGNGQPVEARTTMPRMNKNQALLWMASLTNSNPASIPSQKHVGARDDDIHLRF